MKQKTLTLLAGPNGAGKSTFYDRYLSGLGLPFVNSDIIARREFGEQAEDRPFTAAKLAQAERAALFEGGQSFIMESVLASTPGGVRRLLTDARAAGFQIEAHYIGLFPPGLALHRVASRVASGGHDIPDEIILKRWQRSLENIALLFDLADAVTLYDNSLPAEPHRFVASVVSGSLISRLRDLPRWAETLDLSARQTAQTILL